jgi:hypothetical protein
MSIEVFHTNLGAEWSDDNRHELYMNRERILIDMHTAEVALSVKELRVAGTSRLIAALSLMQEGHLALDTRNPTQICLTEMGRKFAIGIVALNQV